MKHMKRIVALALAVMMLMSLAITASAAETTYKVTINNATGHTYQIYQIFTGDLSQKTVDGKLVDVLSNIVYGDDYVPTGKAVGDPAEIPDDFDPTTIVPTGPGRAMTTTGDTATIEGLEAGYYMIKDTTTNLPNGEDISAIIVQVVGATTINSKHPKTTIIKKVQDINDSTGERPTHEGDTWIDSADYDIGDTVPFKSTATFTGLSNFTTYKVIFTDIMAKGLTYNGGMKVYVNNVDKTSSFTITTAACTDTTGDYVGGTVITVSCDDITDLIAAGANDATIVLEYNAVLNDDARLGAPGNHNKIKVTTKPDGTGETPWDVNVVFTYKVVVNKVDEKDAPLPGAEFQLEKFIPDENGTVTYGEIKGKWVADGAPVKTEAGTTFGFNGLDDGYYRLTETSTPPGYNTIEPIEFEVVAEHVIFADNPSLTSLSGEKVTGEIEFTAAEDAGTLSADVENKAGVVLPETGGIGTTIFYAVGAIMVLVAVVLLVTKKRMASAE